MLHIIANIKTLKEEVRIAHGLIHDIEGVLKKATPSDDLFEKVGIFVTRMPKFKVLERDAEDAKQLLIKVCTREVTPEDALKKIRDAHGDIYLLDSILKQLPCF